MQEEATHYDNGEEEARITEQFKEQVVESTCQQENDECDTMNAHHFSQGYESTTAPAPRYRQRERRKHTRFMINELETIHDDDERLMAQELKGDDAFNWTIAINKKVDTLEAM